MALIQTARQARQNAHDQSRRTLNDIAEKFLQAKPLKNGGDYEARYVRHLRCFPPICGDIDGTTQTCNYLQVPYQELINYDFQTSMGFLLSKPPHIVRDTIATKKKFSTHEHQIGIYILNCQGPLANNLNEFLCMLSLTV